VSVRGKVPWPRTMRIVEICMNPGKGHLSGEGYRWLRSGRGSRAGVVEQSSGRGGWGRDGGSDIPCAE
jgi:hypothetical protein